MDHAQHHTSGRPGVYTTRAAMVALGGIFVVTLAWWSLALWPTGNVPPTWLLRTRQVCFNTGPSGLPDASGWMLLIGQPIGMFAFLMVIAGDGVRAGLQRAQQSVGGRLTLTAAVMILLVGSILSVGRVRSAVSDEEWTTAISADVPDNYPRLDQAVPALGLVDQFGNRTEFSDFVGSPAMITFGFGHCETVCPMMVHNAIRARETLAGQGQTVPLIVITLDPWRDTPSRLPQLATQFMLEDGDRILSGPVEDVNRVLDDLGMARERDLTTGDIIHPSLVYLIDADGTIAYGATGHAPLIEELLSRL